MTATKAILLEGIAETAVQHLKASGSLDVVTHKTSFSGADLLGEIQDATYLGIRSRTQITAEVLESTPNLQAIGCFCIGTNQVDLDAAMARGIAVFNAPHSNTRSVAELILAECVVLLRRLGDKNTAAHQGDWRKGASGSYELRGKSLGIVGYGHIGSQVSVLAEAFGMNVRYYDIIPKLPLGNAKPCTELHDLLRESDLVTLHVPDTAQTRGMFDAETIRAMRPQSYLLNASRGTVVDVDALAEAIKSGHLSGAAIDVFPTEPKSTQEPFSSPLQGLPNVILTPHIGGSTQEAQRNIGVEVATKLLDFQGAGSTIGSVNFPNQGLSATEGNLRLLHIHENRPGILGLVNQVFSNAKANIVGQALQTNERIGYSITDIRVANPQGIEEGLRSVSGTLRVRSISRG